MDIERLPVLSKLRPHGLRNSGNACFLNCSVHLLMCLGPLNSITNKNYGDFTSALKEAYTATSLLVPNSAFWRVTELYLGYSPRALQQNCAGEFLRFFLEMLNSEIKEHWPRRQDPDSWVEVSNRHESESVSLRAQGDSILYDMLGLCLKTEYTTKRTVSYSFQEELILSLQLEDKLTTALQKAFESREITDYEAEGVRTTCRARSLIANFTPFLLMQLQRFQIVEGTVQKLNQRMSFPPKFTIPKKFCTPTLQAQVERKQKLPPEYELRALVEHHGATVNSGHYTAIVKRKDDWVLIDDNLVKPISNEAVARARPYLLLYQQVGKKAL